MQLIKEFKRQNFKNFKTIFTFELFEKNILVKNGILYIDNDEFDFKTIKAVWSRRFTSISYTNFYDDVEKDLFSYFKHDTKKIIQQLDNEFRTIIQYLYFKLKDKVWYPGYNIGNINKLISLDIASSLGLKTPHTYITNKLDNLKSINKPLIVKSAHESMYTYSKKGEYLNMLTRLLDINENSLPENFFLSLIQEKINRKYELRIFFIEEDYYSMAIFSEYENNTTIDSRSHNKVSARNIKYNIPDEVKDKLILLNKCLSLRTGSIDMMFDDNEEYVFLEVNPVGQYGMTSIPCNYNLDFIVASKLIELYG